MKGFLDPSPSLHNESEEVKGFSYKGVIIKKIIIRGYWGGVNPSPLHLRYREEVKGHNKPFTFPSPTLHLRYGICKKYIFHHHG